MRKYRIKYNIRMNSWVPNPPLKIINKLAVRRAKNAEYGPVDFFKVMKYGKKYKIRFHYDREIISVYATTKRRKPKKYKKSKLEKICKPLTLKTYKWYKPGTLNKRLSKKYLKGVKGDANVFGQMGIIMVPRKHTFDIPMINALDCPKMLYDKFGIQIYAPGETLPPLNVKGQTVYMVSYRLNSHYASDYVHGKGGPGIFLEHHSFPHYITPISKDSRGPIVVGKFSRSNLVLVGVNIPIGYTIYLPEHTIHNDWYFIGKIATTVMVDDTADTVFLRGYNAKKIAMNFLQKPI